LTPGPRIRGERTISSPQANDEHVEHPIRLWFVIAPALLFWLNLSLFGTLAVYSGNPGEFLVPYRDILGFFLLPSLIVVSVLVLIASLMGARGRLIYNAFLMFLAVVTYTHGNLLHWDTGVLDGSALDLSQGWRSLVDAGLWAALAWLCWWYRQRLAEHGWRICAALLLFQSIGAAVQARGQADNPEYVEGIPEELTYFSKNTNVVHIILDAFQASIFEHIVQADTDLQAEFEGFTFFRNSVTPSDITYLSVPATLSGTPYTNEISITDYHDQTLGGRNLYTFLADREYAVDVATPVWWNAENDAFSSYYRIPTPYAGDEEGLRGAALLLIDISLFRQAPHFLKPQVYRNGAWLLSNRLVSRPEQQFSHFAHGEFLRDFTQRITARAERPSYKFLHLVTPHAPLVTDASCNFSGEELDYSLDAFGAQSRCILGIVIAFLRQLETLGIYEQSLLVIHGDHGGGVAFEMRDAQGELTDSSKSLHRMWGNPLPLVLIKPPHADGPLRISNEPVSLMDIPATVADLLDFENPFPGFSMFAPDSDRPRVRRYYRSTIHRNDAAAKDRFDNFSSFTIRGSIYDVAAWSEEDYFQAPAMNELGSYTWGTALSFGKRGNFKPFGNGGWSVTGAEDITWTEGTEMGLSMPFPSTPGAVRMSVTLKPLIAPGALDRQRVTILVGGRKLAEWELTEGRFQKMELLIPPGYLNDTGITVFSFRLPDARSPASLGTGKDVRDLALAFLKLQFDLVDPEGGSGG
jgi:hypothetical protein